MTTNHGDQPSKRSDSASTVVLFSDEPPCWGLRGDPLLWKEMAQRFESIAFPESKEQLKSLIEDAFFELTGHSLSNEPAFFVERYSRGGMSSGQICPDFWRKTGVPFLLERFEMMQS